MDVLVAPAVVPIAIEARVDFEFPKPGRRAAEYVPALELALQTSAARLFRDLDEARGWLHAYFDSRISTEAAWDLVSTDSARVVLHPLTNALIRILNRTGSQELTLATWYPSGLDGPSVAFVATEIELQEGSLKARVKAVIAGVAFLVTTAGVLLAGTPGQRLLAEIDTRQRITQKYQGEPCYSDIVHKIDTGSLISAAVEDLNYLDDVDDVEKQRRVCLVQGMLNSTGRYSGKLDGSAGPVTQQGLVSVQKDHQLASHSITDVEVRRVLFDDWQDFLARLRQGSH